VTPGAVNRSRSSPVGHTDRYEHAVRNLAQQGFLGRRHQRARPAGEGELVFWSLGKNLNRNVSDKL